MFNKYFQSYKPFIWLIFSALLAWLANIWFWNQTPGLSWFLWVSMVVTVWFGVEIYRTKQLKLSRFIIGIILIFLSLFVYIRANPFLNWFNILASIWLLFLFCSGWLPTRQSNPFWSRSLPEPVASWWYGMVTGFDKFGLLFNKLKFREMTFLPSLLKGVAITVPILLIFLLLLASSDINYASQVFDVFSDVLRFISLDTLVRLGYTFLLFLVLFGLGYECIQKTIQNPKESIKISSKKLHLETTILLTSLILLFGSYTLFQLSYLYGGHDFVAAQDGTYAQYAKRGFHELLIISSLVFVLLLVSEKLAFGSKHLRHWLFQWLALGLVIEIFGLLISAILKLQLYIQGYGYTNLRIFTMVWIGCMFMSFALYLVRIKDSLPYNWLFNGVLAIFIGGLMFLNLLNPDAFILNYNLNQKNWNSWQISQLSYDAYDVLQANSQHPKVKEFVEEGQRNGVCSFETRIAELEQYDQANWYERNLAKDRATHTMRRIQADYKLCQ